MIIWLYLFPVYCGRLDLRRSDCFALILSWTQEIIDIGLSRVGCFIKFAHSCPVMQNLTININKFNEIYCIKSTNTKVYITWSFLCIIWSLKF
jgi:hypothetical protein